ncbi:MAG TPA: AI-2E family transporter [Thermoanaerobaculia bacterium]|jgi:predicted PurR-regulated permease PerM|nr:AI-2E family transporter [Thermoanaerobaculia bacterium]
MRDTKLILILLGVLVFFAVGFVLHILAPVLVPFVLAVFLSRIFSPLVAALRQRRVPAPLAILLVLILVSIVILIFSVVLYSSAQSFTEAMPRYQARLKGMLGEVSAWLAASFPRLQAQIQHYQWDKAVEISSVTGVAAGMVGSFLVFFNDAFLVLLFLVFLLSGGEAFPGKLRRAFAPEHAERLDGVIRSIEAETRRYLLMKTLINLITGVAVAILLAAFGVDFPLFWGLVTFLAHYIPSLGAVLSVGLPAIFLFLQFSPGMALLIALLNAALQFAVGNVIEPRVMGGSLNLSTLLVLLSLIFWGWLWGPWGMILSVPITSMLKIVCEHVDPLRPLAVLMSGSHGPPPPPQASPARNAEAGAARMPSGLT